MNLFKLTVAFLASGGAHVALFAVKDVPAWLKYVISAMTFIAVLAVLPELPKALDAIEAVVGKIRSWAGSSSPTPTPNSIPPRPPATTGAEPVVKPTINSAVTSHRRPEWCQTQTKLNQSEYMVCENARLASLDFELNRRYDGLRQRHSSDPGWAGFAREQAQWSRVRDACGRNIDCLVQAYDVRIAFLRIATVAAPVAVQPVRPAWCSEQSSFNQAEVTVCSTPRLAELDNELNRAFDAVRGRLGSGPRWQTIRSEQARWNAERDACKADVSCLTNAYQSRLSALVSM